MTQNRSTAVMQRRSEPHDSLDDFPTPPWATRALCEWLIAQGHSLCRDTVREPCANRGYMVRPLLEYFSTVEASDIFDYGAGYPVQDYLFGPLQHKVSWTFMNPPFRLAEQFIGRALATSSKGVAVIVRSAFLEGTTRHKQLFSLTPPSDVLQFTERVVMHKGKLPNPNVAIPTFSKKLNDYVLRKPSSATAYSWIVWDRPSNSTRFHWIPPCREQLEKPEDYL